MSNQTYETSKLEFGILGEATKEQLIETLLLSNDNRAISMADLILKIVGKYGEEVWDLLTDLDYAAGLRRAEIIYNRMKTAGEDRFLPDPRAIRKHVRTVLGVIGIAHHFNEVMEGNPATGKFKLSYEIDRCPYESNWRKMALPSDVRQKLCRCLGWASDMATNDFFGAWGYEDQGLAKQKPTCSFVLYGPKTKEEHESWGNSLPPELKKYYHTWPWCK
jgi:hypothetical protein